jgi:hypothetical protein
VKYKNKDDAQELIEVLKMKYKVKTDWDGTAYVGFRIQHILEKQTLTLSMPKYIEDAVKRFKIDAVKVIDNPLASTTSQDVPSPESKKLLECSSTTQEPSIPRYSPGSANFPHNKRIPCINSLCR